MGLTRETVLFLLIVVFVGVSSFGLGRISKKESLTNNSEIVIEDEAFDGNIKSGDNSLVNLSTEKRYVASKNGKMYYSLGCSGAKRIKTENEVWFKTREDAEKSGFIFSSTCK